jgi:hypothetical protein
MPAASRHTGKSAVCFAIFRKLARQPRRNNLPPVGGDETRDFSGIPRAVVDPENCVRCTRHELSCRRFAHAATA